MCTVAELKLISRVPFLTGLLLIANSCAEPISTATLSTEQAQAKQQATAKRLSMPITQTDSVGIQLNLIPAGSFKMGSPKSELGRQPTEVVHDVTLTRPFYLSATEITQAQWLSLMEKNPSFVEGDDHPVETVSWVDAVEFCRRLSDKEQANYRLPTEAEWEYACRAGTTTAFHTGDTLSSQQANFNGEADDPVQGVFRDESTPVASFPSNAWGLFDMHGNVWEWCGDWHAEYAADPVMDPHGPPQGTTRVVRGGCWMNPSKVCRSASRGDADPTNWNFNFGFRVVREIAGP